MEQTSLYEIFEIGNPRRSAGGGGERLRQLPAAGGREDGGISFFARGLEYSPCGFCPQRGEWKYDFPLSDRGIFRELCCGPARRRSHGLVDTRRIISATRTERNICPFGITCYAWIYQTRELQDETMETCPSLF